MKKKIDCIFCGCSCKKSNKKNVKVHGVKLKSKGGDGLVPMVDYGFYSQYWQKWV